MEVLQSNMSFTERVSVLFQKYPAHLRLFWIFFLVSVHLRLLSLNL